MQPDPPVRMDPIRQQTVRVVKVPQVTRGARVRQEPRDPKVVKVLKVLKVSRETQEPRGARGKRARPARRDHQDPQDLRARQDRQGNRESKVSPVLPVPYAQPVSNKNWSQSMRRKADCQSSRVSPVRSTTCMECASWYPTPNTPNYPPGQSMPSEHSPTRYVSDSSNRTSAS